MAITTISRREMRSTTEDDVILVRRAVRELAQARGFDVFASRRADDRHLRADAQRLGPRAAGRGDHRGGRERRAPRAPRHLQRRGPGDRRHRAGDGRRLQHGAFDGARPVGQPPPGRRVLIESTVGTGTVVTFVKWKRF